MRTVLLMFSLCMMLFADGKALFEKKCASCHVEYIPMALLKENFVEFNNTKLNLKGPTLNQLSFRLKQKLTNPGDDEEFQKLIVTEFVKSYILSPSHQKSLCLKEVQNAFDTMPSMRGKLTQKEMEEIAEYIYDYDIKVKHTQSPATQRVKQALQRAKKEHKLLMIEGVSEYCHFCHKMKKEVLVDKAIQKELKAHYIVQEVDLYKEKLPSKFKFQVTPTLFFLKGDGTLLKSVPGYWGKEDLLKLLQKTYQGVYKQ